MSRFTAWILLSLALVRPGLIYAQDADAAPPPPFPSSQTPPAQPAAPQKPATAQPVLTSGQAVTLQVVPAAQPVMAPQPITLHVVASSPAPAPAAPVQSQPVTLQVTQAAPPAAPSTPAPIVATIKPPSRLGKMVAWLGEKMTHAGYHTIKVPMATVQTAAVQIPAAAPVQAVVASPAPVEAQPVLATPQAARKHTLFLRQPTRGRVALFGTD